MEFNVINYLTAMFLAGIGSFGGGFGGVNIIRDFAANYNWILDEMEILRIISISQFNGYSQGMMLAGYLGAQQELGLGIIGSVLGIITFLIPSAAVLIVIFKIGGKLYKNSVFIYSLKYINLLAAGLIGVILWNYAVLIFELDPIVYLAVAGLAFFVNIYFNVNPAVIVLAGAVIGVIWRAPGG
ncbi:MAG: chromate transporter [Oscillospiraceae bacterium]|nr:chromate transporter [Oscillospiraceae bacterium]